MAKTCKYTRYRRYVSYDGGATYSALGEYQIGYLVERDAEECTSGSTPYERWVDGWMCDDCTSKKLVGYLTGGSSVDVDCDSSSELTSSDVSNKNIYGAVVGDCVSTIGDGAFSGCTSLGIVQLPSTIISIGDNAFNGCSGLTEMGIPNNLTSIGNSAFMGCRQLSNIYLPDNITSIGESAFEECLNFDTINIPSSLTSIPDRCFYHANGLSSLEIPSTITSIGDRAFMMCTQLNYIVFYSELPPTIGYYTFESTPNYFKIYVPSNRVERYKTSTNWSRYADKIYSI